MASSKTVYILGAGASSEAQLPIGATLRDEIAELLNLTFDDFNRRKTGDPLIVDALRAHIQTTGDRRDDDPYGRAAHRVRTGMEYAASIDNYLHQHRGDKEAELCGKLAITRAILQAESGSLMFREKHNDPFPQSNLVSTWFTSLWQVLTDGCHVTDLQARFESVAFVVFNYDRCLEHYLYNSLQAFYSLSPNDAHELMRSLEIHHPYGTVGNLPWMRSQSSAVGFGEQPTARRLLELASLIKTFTESVDPARSDIVAIRDAVGSAEKLVILGFAFYEQNMNLLWPGNPKDGFSGTCYATAYGLSDADVDVVRREISNLTGIAIQTIRIRNDLKCAQLFSEYRRGLRIGSK